MSEICLNKNPSLGPISKYSLLGKCELGKKVAAKVSTTESCNFRSHIWQGRHFDIQQIPFRIGFWTGSLNKYFLGHIKKIKTFSSLLPPLTMQAECDVSAVLCIVCNNVKQVYIRNVINSLRTNFPINTSSIQ